MRNRVLVTCIAVMLIALVLPQTCTADNGPKRIDDRSWTVALYICGDNDLESYWEGMSLDMLLNLPSSSEVSFVAYVDLLSTEGTAVTEIDGGECVTVESFPEMNFGDGATLEWFLRDVSVRYPSDRLAVVAWDHGSAWKGFCRDQTSDGDKIMPQEMRAAITSAGVHIDILAFDACAAASVEMTYEACRTGFVDLMVASEELVAGNGFPYDMMFDDLVADPSMTPAEVACEMVSAWEEYYIQIGWSWYATLGVIDVGYLSENLATLRTWTERMLAGVDENFMDYRNALKRSSSVSCVSHYQVDMVDLGRHLLETPALTHDDLLRQATQDMIAAVEGAVVEVYNPPRMEMCGGMSLFWGLNNEEWRYYWEMYTTEITFASETSWGEFLVEFNELTCGWFPPA